MIASLRRLLILVLIVTLPIWMSALIWYSQPTLPLKLSLVDYTVPYDNYAEHSASIWAFNHLKLTPPLYIQWLWQKLIKRKSEYTDSV